MRATISVVIPTLNASAELPDCLGALMEGLEAGLIRELVISDGGSGDATLAMADEVGAIVVKGPASRGGQLRRGCAAAQGDWLLVLHADTMLEPGWSRTVVDHVADPGAGPACFRLGFRASGLAARWVAGWANLRTRVFGLPYGDQGLLLRRAEYDRAGGYADQPLMEDVAMVRALPGRVTVLPARAMTSAERYQRDGWIRRGARNLCTLTRYFAGADVNKLNQGYRR